MITGQLLSIPAFETAGFLSDYARTRLVCHINKVQNDPNS